MRYVVLLLALSLFSCENDDAESQTISISRLIGRWEGYTQSIERSNGQIEDWRANRCQGNILEFYDDGRILWIDFVEGELPDNCQENQDTAPIGTWEIIDDKILITLQSSDAGNSSVKYIGPFKVRFNEITIDFIFDELPDGAPSDTVEYYSTYFKD